MRILQEAACRVHYTVPGQGCTTWASKGLAMRRCGMDTLDVLSQTRSSLGPCDLLCVVELQFHQAQSTHGQRRGTKKWTILRATTTPVRIQNDYILINNLMIFNDILMCRR